MATERPPKAASRRTPTVRRPSTYLLAALLLAVLWGVAYLLASRDTTLTVNQAQLVAPAVEAVPLDDPFSPVWEAAARLEAVMVPQASASPMLSTVVVPTVRVRAVHDGQWIGFLLEWDDPTPDWGDAAPGEFPDRAAIQFAVNDGLPSVCMGSPGQLVNLWVWHADWQRDMDRGFRDVPDLYPHFYQDQYPGVNELTATPPFAYPVDFAAPDARLYSPGWRAGNPRSLPERPSPVEDAIAEGFGTIHTRASQPVTGRGAWQDGRWRVVFARPLQTGERDARQFRAGEVVHGAFAVWDGAHQNRGGRKQLSPFYTVLLQEATGR